MVLCSNIFGLELKEIRDDTLVIYNNRTIAKLTKDGTMLADVREVRRNAAVIETLGITRAMFLIEQAQHFEDIFKWSKIGEFSKLTLNCYFIFHLKWFHSVLKEAAPRLQNLEELQITSPQPMDTELFYEIAKLFPNMTAISILDHHLER